VTWYIYIGIPFLNIRIISSPRSRSASLGNGMLDGGAEMLRSARWVETWSVAACG
jgi:hypothetical protein